MHFLVNGVKENLHKDLVSTLHKEVSNFRAKDLPQEMLPALLVEDPHVAEQRKVCTDQVAALKKARQILKEAQFPEFFSS